MFLLIGILFLAFSPLIINVLDSCSYEYPKIKFESFKKFYVINPSRWTLYDNHVLCDCDVEVTGGYFVKYGCINKEYIRLKFSFWETFRYIAWLKNKEKEDRKLKDVEDLSKVISVVKDDIINLEKHAEKEMNKGVEIYIKVLENLNNGEMKV